jgi:hypothetical protein
MIFYAATNAALPGDRRTTLMAPALEACNALVKAGAHSKQCMQRLSDVTLEIDAN